MVVTVVLKKVILIVLVILTALPLSTAQVFTEYEFKIHINSECFNNDQIRLNTEAYILTDNIFNKTHIERYYDSSSKIFNSFKDNIDPIMLLAISCSEWGGHTDMRYTWCPVIPAQEFKRLGIEPYQVELSKIDSYYLVAMGVITGEESNKYKGSLQINSSYFKPDTKTYKCGNVPMDYYNWTDQVEWYTHTYSRYFSNAFNPDYYFNSKYELLANLSIMGNTGPGYVSNEYMSNDSPKYPWLSDSNKIFEYCREITKDSNLDIIKNSAMQYVEEIQNKKNIQLTRYKANDLVELMNLEASLYVKSSYVDLAFKDSPSQPNEKLVHPISAIWSYMVIESLYKGGI